MRSCCHIFMIESVGGRKKWDELQETEKKKHPALMMEQLVIELGKEAYEMLSDHEKKNHEVVHMGWL